MPLVRRQGNVVFEKFALFDKCYTARQDGEQFDDEGNELYDASSGGGGAIYHHVKGTMTFLDGLTMTNNTADSYVSNDALNILQTRRNRWGARSPETKACTPSSRNITTECPFTHTDV